MYLFCLPLAVGSGLAVALFFWIENQPDSPANPEHLPWLADATELWGLDFTHDPGPLDEKFFMPQIMGSGCALFDYDGDGRLDIYILNNAGPASGSSNRLFHQESDGRFSDRSDGSGLDIAGYGMGAAIGDVNNDGRPDVLITEFGATRLLVNGGAGKFSDITSRSGLDNPAWGCSAAFFDYDRDGWLDVVIANYLDFDPTRPCTSRAGLRDYCHPSAFSGMPARLFRNRGEVSDSPTPAAQFEDRTIPSGLASAPGPGLGVLCADFSGDGWPDVFVANDSQANHLWINQHDGTFRDEAVQRGVAFNGMGEAQANMGIAWGDVQGDGRGDLFVTHLTEQYHALWSQMPAGMFCDQTAAAALARPIWRGTGFGTALVDFDHDADLDLAIVNGRVSRGPHYDRSLGLLDWRHYAERNQLFANDGSGRFQDVSPAEPPFCGTPGIARGLACGDVDNDGAMDLLVTYIAGPARLFRNVTPDRGHWLMVRAVDPALGGRDAYGAELVLRAGDRRWIGLVQPGGSYLCSHDPRVHFGLGDTSRIDALEVVWPDGSREQFPAASADQVVTLRKGGGAAATRSDVPANPP